MPKKLGEVQVAAASDVEGTPNTRLQRDLAKARADVQAAEVDASKVCRCAAFSQLLLNPLR